MPCIDNRATATFLEASRRVAALSGLVLAVGLAGCGSKPSAPAPATAPAAAPTPVRPSAAPAPAPATGGVRLPPPGVSKNWNEYKLQAARRVMAANPSGTFTGKPQQMLLAAPVLSIELNADGSIQKIDILRRPSQAQETVQLAIDAVRRAAPFGDVSKLPKPWTFAETFLFNDDKRFKPRTIDAL
ncbi:MAG: hypothetical protein ABW190_14180 [Rhizobacter sp.]